MVNDRQFRIWRSFAISAWPTLVVVDPAGYVVGTRAGEFTAQMLEPFIGSIIAAAEQKGILNRDVRAISPDLPNTPPGRLRYPGKVAVRENRIAIADSGNNQVIVGTLSEGGRRAVIDRVIGSGRRGFDSGASASFDSPQGLVFGEDALYVADRENHAVRAINLRSWEVTTIAGTGRQLRSRSDREEGALSSPWDLALHGNVLFIAMAGVHQIWTLDLTSHRLRIHAGTGVEDIRDGPSNDAFLAQPMGITVHAERAYFADAESSAIRWTDTAEAGQTQTIVGTGLFDFGDVDGTGEAVRMQHQQGVTFSRDGRLIVADSYNDSLRLLDPVSKSATTWLRGFNEPGGLAAGGDFIYVADTNAHRVLAVNQNSGETEELTLT